MEVLAAHTEALDWPALRQHQPPDVLARVARLHQPADQRRTLLGRWLLRQALLRHGHPPALSAVQYTAHGKPFLPGAFHFNLSHAGQWVVLAVSPLSPVGIDIEVQQPISMADFDAVFTPAQLAEIGRALRPEIAFCHHWTRHESLLKATGLGLSLPPNAIVWHPDGSATAAGQRWHFQPLAVAAGYSCCLCAIAPPGPISLHYLSAQWS